MVGPFAHLCTGTESLAEVVAATEERGFAALALAMRRRRGSHVKRLREAIWATRQKWSTAVHREAAWFAWRAYRAAGRAT